MFATVDGCNTAQTYIGFTTCSIATRFRYHSQKSSTIKKHLKGVHNIDKVAMADLIPNVSIAKYSSDKCDLMFYESLLIRENKPTLNSQVEFSDKILEIYTVFSFSINVFSVFLLVLHY